MEESVNQNRAPKEYSDDKGGATLYKYPIIGIVKHNIDASKTGQIRVLLKRHNGSYPEDVEGNWSKPISYMSPFFGYTPNDSSKDNYGSYAGNPHSYGMWMTPPDIGTEVLCIFVNGDPNFGYYIGCLPKPGLNHMVPAIGAVDQVILNDGEAGAYGGAKRLPVGEINNANDKQATAGTLAKQPRPVHSTHAATFFKQGLLRDPDRGPISSSAQRESPSRVFGISTPGRPIYAGGYTDDNIKAAIKNPSVPDANLKVTGRVGGHTFVMDDGDVEGHDQLVRLRTAGGHTLLMNDASQTLMIMHANGQSYIELGKEGTIDMYATNSVNIRSQGDLNLHADRDININANRNLNVMGVGVHLESQKDTTFFTGKAMNTTVLGTHTHKVGGAYSIMADMSIGLTSLLSPIYMKGSIINLNSGMSPVLPMPSPQLPRTLHTDTLFSSKAGYTPAPKKLSSIVSRAPAHFPWDAAGKGVDVTTDLNAPSNAPTPPSSVVSQINANVPAAPDNPTTPSLQSTVPTVVATTTGSIDAPAASAMASQMAVTAATGPGGQAVQAGAGVVDTGTGLKASIGNFAATPSQLVDSGHLKPGSDYAINASVASGLGLKAAMPPNLFTGKDGINNVDDLVKSTTAQTNIAVDSLNQAKTSLTKLGVLNGNENISSTGGLIMASAVAGVGKVMQYASGSVNYSLIGDATKSFLKGDIAGATTSFSTFGSGISSSITSGYNNFTSSLSTSFNNYADSASKIGSSITGGMDSLKEGWSSLTSEMGSSIDSLMSGGLFASISVEEKLNTSMVDNFIKSLQGAAQGAYEQLIATFKSLPAGVPISLSAANSGGSGILNEYGGTSAIPTTMSLGTVVSETDVGTLMDTAKGGTTETVTTYYNYIGAKSSSQGIYTASTEETIYIPGDNPTPLTNNTTGVTAVATSSGTNADMTAEAHIVDAGKSNASSVAGLGVVTGAVAFMASAINSPSGLGAAVGSAQQAVATAGSLENMVNTGLSKLGGALGALGLGGPFQTKLPIIAQNMTKDAAVKAKSKELLGDPKIPPLNTGKEAKTDAEVSAENQKLAEINKAVAEQDKAYYAWRSDIAKYGDDSPQAQASYANFCAVQDAMIATMDKLA